MARRDGVVGGDKLRAVVGEASICYLIGAGFGAATRFHLPTAVGFLERRFDYCDGDGETQRWDTDDRHADYGALLNRIEREYGELKDLNLETVLTDLYVRAFGVGRAWELGRDAPLGMPSLVDIERDYHELRMYIVARLRLQCGDSLTCPLARRLAESLQPQDSVLTLNYDTILERHLRRAAVGVPELRLSGLELALGPPGTSYGGRAALFLDDRRSPGQGVFTKLHGSIDWYTCPNQDCPNHSYIQAANSWRSDRLCESIPGRCVCCAMYPQGVIIPPVAAKEFSHFLNLQVMWSQSYYALRHAHRWVLMGVSLAPTDFHLASLLRSASQHARFPRECRDKGQICIVDPCAKRVRERLLPSLSPAAVQGLEGGGDGIVVFESIEEYLRAAEGTDVGRQDVPKD